MCLGGCWGAASWLPGFCQSAANLPQIIVLRGLAEAENQLGTQWIRSRGWVSHLQSSHHLPPNPEVSMHHMMSQHHWPMWCHCLPQSCKSNSAHASYHLIPSIAFPDRYSWRLSNPQQWCGCTTCWKCFHMFFEDSLYACSTLSHIAHCFFTLRCGFSGVYSWENRPGEMPCMSYCRCHFEPSSISWKS